MWTETLEEGLILLREAKPDIVLVSDQLPDGSEPTGLLKAIQSYDLATQVVVMTATADFERAMDYVTLGIFAVVTRPIGVERLRTIVSRIVENSRLFETITQQITMIDDNSSVLAIYKNLAGHLESGPLLKALSETAKKITGATEAITNVSEDMTEEPNIEAFDRESLTINLNWMGRELGTLKLRFESQKALRRVSQSLIDELTCAGSMFLGQAIRFEEAIKMASRDPLTGLCNQRIFIETIEREFRQARRYNSPLSLLTLDLDNFKNVNDTYGHQVGDEVLKWLAKVIKGVVRSGDLAARVGGEEFAIILPRTNLEQATNLAQRLKNSLDSTPIPNLLDLPKPTISQGLASLEHFLVNSTQDLIYWADQAMYLAKREGRNTVRSVSDLPSKTNFQDVQYAFQ
jgi:diguanylate cyclase (GGDEF)-like protein